MREKVIKSIFLFYFLTSFFFLKTNAQVVYTNLNPDSTFFFTGCTTYPCPILCEVCNVDHYIDLNNDGTNDFHSFISIVGGSATCMGFPSVDWNDGIYLYTEDSNSISIQNGNFVRQYNLADTISSQDSWNTGFTYVQQHEHFGCTNNSLGIWSGTGYVGLKLKTGSQEYYGWAQIFADAGYFSTPTSLILYDYAFNSIAGQFILAGDTGAGPAGIIHLSHSYNTPNVSPNPFSVSTTLTINSPIILQDARLKIYDMTGRAISNYEIKNQQTEIKRENLSSGIYFYKVQNENEIIGSGKLVVQ